MPAMRAFLLPQKTAIRQTKNLPQLPSSSAKPGIQHSTTLAGIRRHCGSQRSGYARSANVTTIENTSAFVRQNLRRTNFERSVMDVIEAVKASWSWVGIDPVEVVGETDFGNLMIRDTQGKYWRLCPEDLYCRVVANSRSELDALSQNQEFSADWYMSNLTALATEKLGPLKGERKYHFAIPGVLGGKYDVENIRTVSQIEQIRFSGDIGMQIKDLPDGVPLTLKVIE
jgi:hypothetical protein